MDNSAQNKPYKTLAQSLIQSGLILNEHTPDTDDKSNIFASQKEVAEQNSPQKTSKKRINEYDLELVKNISAKNTIDNAINFKTMASLGLLKSVFKKGEKDNKILNLFFKFFPKLKQAKLVKDTLSELSRLKGNAQNFACRTIPYGEANAHYQELVEYLNCVNEIEAKLKNSSKR